MLLQLNLEENKKFNLTITDSHEVFNSKGETTKLESSSFLLELTIKIKSREERTFDVLVTDIKQKFVNIPKSDRDYLDKSLQDVKLTYSTKLDGSMIGFSKSIKAFRKIRSNVRKIVGEGENIGMQPGDEALVAEMYEDIMVGFDLEELFDNLKKYHKYYGQEFTDESKQVIKGQFNRRIANTRIPTEDIIQSSINEELNIYEYSKTKGIDVPATLKIINSKAPEEFRLFDKDKLREQIEAGQWNFGKEENIRYEINQGLITLLETKNIASFSNKIVDSLRFELS